MDVFKNKYAIAISIGAVFGSLSRYYFTEFIRRFIGNDAGFIATFLINVSGCILIAYILTLANNGNHRISPELRLMTTTGFCGAFTTFSTYGLEMQMFANSGHTHLLLLYGMGSAIAGMIGIKLGVLLAELRT